MTTPAARPTLHRPDPTPSRTTPSSRAGGDYARFFMRRYLNEGFEFGTQWRSMPPVTITACTTLTSTFPSTPGVSVLTSAPAARDATAGSDDRIHSFEDLCADERLATRAVARSATTAVLGSSHAAQFSRRRRICPEGAAVRRRAA
jgi:hypothetical protein